MFTGGAEAHRQRNGRKARLAAQSGLCGIMMLGLFGVGMASAQSAPPQTPSAPQTQATPDATAKPADAKTPAKPEDKPADKPAAAAPPADSTTVTITGQKSPNRIDRQSYDVSKDPDSATGTAADSLNKVPGVNVDASGNVTLRGKNVQILVNGKPSAMMSGDNRAAALQAMPSSVLNTVEVISNPGAQYGSDGGQMLNITTKAKLPPGGFGTVGAQVGNNGSNAILFGQYHVGDLTTTGAFRLGHTTNKGQSGSILRQLDSSGNTTRRTGSNSRNSSATDNIFTFGNLEYSLTDKDTLSGQLSYNRYDSNGNGVSNGAIYDASGAATDIYARLSGSGNAGENESLGGNWSHTGDTQGESLKVDMRLSRSLSDSSSSTSSTYTRASLPINFGTRLDSKVNNSDAKNGVFSIDYARQFGDDQVSAGIQITYDDYASLNQSFGPDAVGVTPTANALLSNRFTYIQEIDAAYFTYQKPLGDHWTILGGLRSETLTLDTEELLSHTKSHVEYTKLNPSFYVSYVLSAKAKIRASYSKRLQRPAQQDLNPFLRYQSATSVSQGNPNLKPQETDSYELGYEYAYQTTSYSLRSFYRRNYHVQTQVSTIIPDPQNAGNQVVLTTRQTFGKSDDGGLEFSYNGKMTPQLSIGTNGNLIYSRLQSPTIVGSQSAMSPNGQVYLNYNPTKKDVITFRYNVQGKRLTGEGYIAASGQGSMQYSHTFANKFSLLIVANDVFRSSKSRSVTDSSTIYSESVNSRQAPTLFIGLSRSFGSFKTPTLPGQGVRPAGGPPPGGGTVIRMGPG